MIFIDIVHDNTASYHIRMVCKGIKCSSKEKKCNECHWHFVMSLVLHSVADQSICLPWNQLSFLLRGQCENVSLLAKIQCAAFELSGRAWLSCSRSSWSTKCCGQIPGSSGWEVASSPQRPPTKKKSKFHWTKTTLCKL